MAINKVVYDGNTLIDLTNDDVTASDVASGVYFHTAAGVRTAGTMTETDPIFTNSAAYGISSTDITNWDNSYNGKVSLDTTAASGTTDGDLYAAIVALGWENDVIE